MVWDFFQRRVCLTTEPERWEQAQVEFARVGLEVRKFQSIPDIGPHQSFSRSVKRILQEFYWSNSDTLLLVEDDCEFKDLTHLENALTQLPTDWDVVYLGANLLLWGNGQEPKPERISDNICRIRAAWTTHCVGFRRKAIPHLLMNQPGFSEIMFDTWLSNELYRLSAFVVSPMVAYQRPGHSLIWGRHDDYTPIFEASDERLRVA